MYVDFKVSVWYRAELRDDLTDEEIQELKRRIENDSLHSSDLFSEGLADDFSGWTAICETEEDLRPSDNDGEATVELLDDDRVVITDNANYNPDK